MAQNATELSKAVVTHVVPAAASGSAAGFLGAAAIKSTGAFRADNNNSRGYNGSGCDGC